MIEPRHYQSVKDVQAMQELLMAGRKAENGTYYIHPSDLSWWLYYPPLDGDFWDHIYLWDDPEEPGQLSGWCLLTPGWVGIDVYLQPWLRGSQRATEMWLWAEEHATQLARQKSRSTLHVVWVWHGDEILEAHLVERGFQLRRGYVYLSRSIEAFIPSTVPLDGFVLRSCRGEPEVNARAKCQYATFGSSAPFERYLERFTRFMRSPAYNPNLDVVAVSQDGRVGAFCILWIDKINKLGHFEPVGTQPGFQRKGLGRAIMLEGLKRLQQAGMTTAAVVTDDDNAAAIKLYEAVGFQVTGRLGTYEKDV